MTRRHWPLLYWPSIVRTLETLSRCCYGPLDVCAGSLWGATRVAASAPFLVPRYDSDCRPKCPRVAILPAKEYSLENFSVTCCPTGSTNWPRRSFLLMFHSKPCQSSSTCVPVTALRCEGPQTSRPIAKRSVSTTAASHCFSSRGLTYSASFQKSMHILPERRGKTALAGGGASGSFRISRHPSGARRLVNAGRQGRIYAVALRFTISLCPFREHDKMWLCASLPGILLFGSLRGWPAIRTTAW